MFFIGDQLCSHSRAIADMMTAACLLRGSSDSSFSPDNNRCLQQSYQQRFVTIAALVPLAARALQCIRRYVDVRVVQGIGGHPALSHVLNCLKYCLGILVAAMHGKLQGGDSSGAGLVWYGLACVSVTYAFWWDVSRDWGLECSPCDMKNGGLRGDLMFLPHWSRRGGLYYAAAGLNLVCRFSSLIAAVVVSAEWNDVAMLILGLIEVMVGICTCSSVSTQFVSSGLQKKCLELFSNGMGTSAPPRARHTRPNGCTQLHCCGGEWRPVRDISMQ
jgi:hypothetical protein